MQRTLCKILISVFLLFFLNPHTAYSQEEVRNIVMFFRLNSNVPGYQRFLEGFKSTLSDEIDEPYNLMVEYLDIGRSQDNAYFQHVVDIYNENFSSLQIDLLLTIGPGSRSPDVNSLLLKYGLDMLGKTPAISLSNQPTQTLNLPDSSISKIVDVQIDYNFTKTLEKAVEIFPEHKNIYIISGNSNLDDDFARPVLKAAREFEKTHNIKYIHGISLDSTLVVVRSIPEESIILLPTFLSDKRNLPYSNPEALSIISNSSKAPVFPMFDSFIIRQGGLGGYVFSYYNVGRETGKLALEILHGNIPGDTTLGSTGLYQNIYDWQQLKRWNLLDSKAIPANSIFFNEENNFLKKYKWFILTIFLFLIFETILIVYLIRLNRRQKHISRQKEETEILYRELIREDRLLRMVELTASLSHELSQPLTAILYNAQAGKRFMQSENPDIAQVSEILDNIISDDKRAAGIIGSIKNLMKIESREMEKENLNPVIEDAIKIFHSEATKQHIYLKINMLKDPVIVTIDKIQIEQVLLNFFFNATIAMEELSSENKVIELTQTIDNGYVTVSVKDSGPGIDDSIRDNLFKSFVTTRKYGFGIGLAVSRSIIEKHRGKIQGRNIPGGGAEFSFALKIAADE